MNTVGRRFKVVVNFLGSFAAVLIILFSYKAALSADNVVTTNVQELPGLIGGERGRPVLVVLYSSGCSLSRNLWPEIIGFARRQTPTKMALLVLSIDGSREAAESFLAAYNLPFRGYWVEPWEPGTLDSAMRPIGINIGKSFYMPLVAVLDGNGKVVAQWQGLQDFAKVERALKSLGAI